MYVAILYQWKIDGCSNVEMPVQFGNKEGEFHAANAVVTNSSNTLELELPAPHIFLENTAITLELNFSQPGMFLL